MSKENKKQEKVKEDEIYDEIKGLDPSFFALNRENYLKNLKIRFAHLNTNSVIIFQGGKLAPKYDTDTYMYYFDQESNFYYLTGVREPNMMLVLDVQSGEGTLFYEQEPDEYKVWMVVPTTGDIEQKYEMKTYLKRLFLSIGWFLLLIVPYFFKHPNYAMTTFILWDKPDVQNAVKESKHLMKGNKERFANFELSFTHWYLLVLVTAFIAGIWVMPYLATAEAVFYEDLKTDF